MVTDEEFLQSQGGVLVNSLNSKLNTEDNQNDENDQIQIIKHSPYFDNQKFNSLIKTKNKCFSICSSNIQCLNANYDELNIFINDLRTQKFQFNLICLQESWLSENDATDHLKLDNYQLIPQGKSCSSKGGLVIYLQTKFEYETIMKPNKYDSLEEQVIKITKGRINKHLIIANIYRPPKDLNEKYRQFTNELMPILKSLETKNVIITGDLNIDLLKINEKKCFK